LPKSSRWFKIGPFKKKSFESEGGLTCFVIIAEKISIPKKVSKKSSMDPIGISDAKNVLMSKRWRNMTGLPKFPQEAAATRDKNFMSFYAT